MESGDRASTRSLAVEESGSFWKNEVIRVQQEALASVSLLSQMLAEKTEQLKVAERQTKLLRAELDRAPTLQLTYE